MGGKTVKQEITILDSYGILAKLRNEMPALKVETIVLRLIIFTYHIYRMCSSNMKILQRRWIRPLAEHHIYVLHCLFVNIRHYPLSDLFNIPVSLDDDIATRIPDLTKKVH